MRNNFFIKNTAWMGGFIARFGFGGSFSFKAVPFLNQYRSAVIQ